MIEKRKLTIELRAKFMQVLIGMAKGFGYKTPTQLMRDIRACWDRVPNDE